jgi:hypothetical protein
VRSKTVVDANVAALRPSESFEPLTERRNTQLHFAMIFGQACEHNDMTYAIRLLRAGRNVALSLSVLRARLGAQLGGAERVRLKSDRAARAQRDEPLRGGPERTSDTRPV